MKFPYVKIHGQLKPIIPVTLRYSDACRTEALVDSEAVASIFHAEYAAESRIENIEDGGRMHFAGISATPVEPEVPF